jgi:hypothetical protein
MNNNPKIWAVAFSEIPNPISIGLGISENATAQIFEFSVQELFKLGINCRQKVSWDPRVFHHMRTYGKNRGNKVVFVLPEFSGYMPRSLSQDLQMQNSLLLNQVNSSCGVTIWRYLV